MKIQAQEATLLVVELKGLPEAKWLPHGEPFPQEKGPKALSLWASLHIYGHRPSHRDKVVSPNW